MPVSQSANNGSLSCREHHCKHLHGPPQTEQGQGPTLQTSSSLLYREGPKRLSNGHGHAAEVAWLD